MMVKGSTATSLVWLAGGLISCVSAKAILGVDLGSLYMKVALVQRGAPLEIVTNLHSKRKTEQMILFDQGSRFYGADASSLLARKPTKTPSAFSVMLGRSDDHPAVKILTDWHYPLPPFFNETRHGLEIMVDKKETYTPEELAAMVLGHAREITFAYAAEKGSTLAEVRDVVLTIPAFATQAERQAYINAAQLANMNVLGLIEENTAAALQFGMNKAYEDPKIFLFYNLGGTSLQVSVVKFHSYEVPESKYSKKMKTVGSIEILGKAWDATLGGQSFDNRLVEYFADHFNREWRKARKHNKDIRDIPRAMTKIRLQANKVKHVLSANSEIPVHMDSLYDDMSLSLHMTRDHFEELCADLMERAVAPVTKALAMADVKLDEVDEIELIGGGMRVPKVQTDLSAALGGKELGLHINSDESMALGASFYGANASTAFRVRQVGLTDVNPFPVGVSLSNIEEKASEEEAWSKQATIFKALGKLGVKKTIAFTHDEDVHCALDYDDVEYFPEGVEKTLQRYKITGVSKFAKEMEEKGLGKPKVSLQFELSASGITSLVKAEAAVEETYTVEEEEEVDDDELDGENKADEDSASDDNTDETTEDASNETSSGDDADTASERKTEEKPAKKKKTVKVEKGFFGFRTQNPAFVQKEKKRMHKKSLDVETYYVGKVQPYSAELMAESKAKMDELDRKDKERVMLEAARNKVESYIYKIRNKLADDEEIIAKVTTEEQRDELRKIAEDAEEWLYDADDADLTVMEAKFTEISEPAEKVWFRASELTTRPEAVEAMQKKLGQVEDLMEKWKESRPQVTEEERADVLAKVADIRKWIEEKEAEQAAKPAYEDVAYTSEEVPLQSKGIEKLLAKLSKKPKPKPEKTEADEKNETAEGASGEDKNETSQAEEGSPEVEEAEETSEAEERAEAEL